MLMLEDLPVPGLPATSVQVPLADCPAPSALKVTGAEQPLGATPESASVALKATVTGTPSQPAPWGVGLTLADTTGGVRSILIPLAVTVALTFPALSAQVPG